jgi:hypothetical protein
MLYVQDTKIVDLRRIWIESKTKETQKVYFLTVLSPSSLQLKQGMITFKSAIASQASNIHQYGNRK